MMSLVERAATASSDVRRTEQVSEEGKGSWKEAPTTNVCRLALYSPPASSLAKMIWPLSDSGLALVARTSFSPVRQSSRYHKKRYIVGWRHRCRRLEAVEPLRPGVSTSGATMAALRYVGLGYHDCPGEVTATTRLNSLAFLLSNRRKKKRAERRQSATERL